MKKLGLMILPALFLTACDRPMTDELEIRCPELSPGICSLQMFEDKIVFTQDGNPVSYALAYDIAQPVVDDVEKWIYTSDSSAEFNVYMNTKTNQIIGVDFCATEQNAGKACESLYGVYPYHTNTQ